MMSRSSSVYVMVLGVLYLSCSFRAASSESQLEPVFGMPCMWQGQQYLVQLGIPRTASTWQAETLCGAVLLATELLHQDPDYFLDCTFSNRPLELIAPPPRHFTVIKTHNRSAINLPQPSPATLFFASSSLGKTQTDQEPCYRQSYDLLVERGLGMLRDYQTIFQLSEKHYIQLRSYMQNWEIIRKCCGFQASCDNIVELNSLQQEGERYGNRFEVSADYPSCSIYNLTAVEEMLVETSIWKKRSWLRGKNKHNQPLPFHFNGIGYCATTNEQVKQGRGFNGNPLKGSSGLSCHKF